MTYVIQWRRYPQDTAFFHASPADTFPAISSFTPHFATIPPFLLTHPFSQNSQPGANTTENRNIHARKLHAYSKTTGKQGQSDLLESRAQPVGNALPSQCKHARNRSEANRRLTIRQKNVPTAVENPAAESVETLFYISFGCPYFYILLDDKEMRKIASKNPSDPSREPKQAILSH